MQGLFLEWASRRSINSTHVNPALGELCRRRAEYFHFAEENSAFFVVAASCAEKTAERQQQQQRVETDNDDDREVPPPPTSSANHDDDDGRSRDPATMTSSEPERGDSAAECQQAETPPSVDSDNDNVVVQTVTGVEGQTYTQAAATSADGTSSPGADRKQNSDEPEASSAGSSGTPWFSL